MAQKQQSPIVLITVVALHAAALGGMLYYQPRISAANAEVMHVSLITAPSMQPSPQPPVPPKPRLQPKKFERTITVPPPLELPSETAISEPPAPPEPAPVVATAPSEPPAPPAQIVLPRFDADYLQNPPPVYPLMSRRAGEQGRVMLRVVVRSDGTPQSVEVRNSSGWQRLDEAALDAVRRWRFVPARQGNTPISAAVIVPIVFSLEG